MMIEDGLLTVLGCTYRPEDLQSGSNKLSRTHSQFGEKNFDLEAHFEGVKNKANEINKSELFVLFLAIP